MCHIHTQLLYTLKEIVNAIAADTYEKLESLVELTPDWQSSEEGSDKSAIQTLRHFITTNYNGWAEDEGKPYIIHTFQEKNCSPNWETVAEELQQKGSSTMSYDLMTTDNDPDYFWLELDFTLTKDNQIHTILNINF